MDTGWHQRASSGGSHLPGPEGAGHPDHPCPGSWTHRPGSGNSCGQGLGCAQRGPQLLTAEWTVYMKAEALWQFGPQGQTRAGDCGPRGPSWGGPGAGRPRGSLYSWRLLCGGPASPPVSRPSQDPIQTRGADGSPQTCLQTDIFFQVPRGLAPGQGRGGGRDVGRSGWAPALTPVRAEGSSPTPQRPRPPGPWWQSSP